MARSRQNLKGVFLRESKWWIRYVDVDGKRKSRRVGTIDDALAAYRVEKARIKKHIPATPTPAHAVRYSELVDDAIRYSLSRHKDVRMFSARLLKSKEQFGNRLAASIRPAEVSAWLGEHGWAPGTQNRHKAAMSKAYKLAIQAEKCSVNPARLVPQAAEPSGRVRFLSQDEESRIRTAMATRPSCIPQFDMAIHTGMRKGEQFRVSWSQVNLAQRHIHLSTAKNGSSRYVHLNSTATRVLTELKAEHERLGLPEDATLFINARNTPIADPREWFTNVCVEAKVTGVTWHTLRHTFCSRLVMAGVDLTTVQHLMGHKTASMTARYAHLSAQHQHNALERLVAA